MTAVVWVLAVAGSFVVAIASLVAVAVPHVLDRLHLLTICTSLGTPLIALSLVLDQGWSGASAMILFTATLVTVTGPVSGAALAHATAQRDSPVRSEEPE